MITAADQKPVMVITARYQNLGTTTHIRRNCRNCGCNPPRPAVISVLGWLLLFLLLRAAIRLGLIYSAKLVDLPQATRNSAGKSRNRLSKSAEVAQT